MDKKLLNIPENVLLDNNGIFTASEISGQPALWKKTLDVFNKNKLQLNSFMGKVCAHKDANIILTGAGTSAYIGEVLEGPLQTALKRTVRAIATTDIVTHPALYFLSETPTLLISFARSGDSPESVRTVELAQQLCKQLYLLNITCNDQGALATRFTGANVYTHLLPPESDDKSLAMTGSFSAMLMSGLLLGYLNKPEFVQKNILKSIEYGQILLDKYLNDLKNTAEMKFERAVFLGSGLFRGIARESHLKLQELTDGQVICKHDSFLGFRHGPKAVITNETLIVSYISNNEYARRYEADLINAVNNGNSGLFQIAIMEKNYPEIKADLKIVLSDDDGTIEEEFLAIPFIIAAQILGFFKSLQLNLQPDTPSASGTITRVVEGVKVYPYKSVGA